MKVEDMGRGFEQIVQQEHMGANGNWFSASSFSGTPDPVRSVLEAQEKTYNGVSLGQVETLRLIAK
jgi:hypothetical protein